MCRTEEEEQAAIRIQAVVRGRAARRRDKLRADLPTQDGYPPEPAQTERGDERVGKEPEPEVVPSSSVQVEAAQAEIRQLLAETAALDVSSGGVRLSVTLICRSSVLFASMC